MQEKSLRIAILKLTAVGGAHYHAKLMNPRPDFGNKRGAPAATVETQKESSRDIASILAERGKVYGQFHEHAEITQLLKAIMSACPKWASLQHDQHEALEMIAHKIGRILNGDPHYADSWADIAGYAQLVANRLNAPSVHST